MFRVEPNSTIFISNLPATSDTELLDLCQSYGKVKNVQYIPDKRGYNNKAFVTFNNLDTANLALFSLRNIGTWKGRKLKVNYKIEKEEEGEKTKKKPEKANSVKVVAPEKDPLKPRLIPGLVPEKPKNEQVVTSIPDLRTSVPAVPALSVSSPPLIPSTPVVSQVAPQFEITIRNLSNGEIFYQFRPENHASLKQYLLSESEPGTTQKDLFQASVPYKSESVTYRGLPVVHFYAENLLGEILDPIENGELRKNNFKKAKLTPLTKAAMPFTEVEEFLISKGFSPVYVNTDVNGVLAPLLPGWKPNPGQHGFKKGPTVICVGVSDGIISSCSFVRSTSSITKELQPLFLKYKVVVLRNADKRF